MGGDLPIKFETGAPKVTAADEFKEQSLTAITSLASASSTATEFGHANVAQAGERVQYMIFQIYQAPSPDAVPAATFEELKIRVAVLEDQIAKDKSPSTKAFRCQKDFEECRARSPDKVQQMSCWMSYLACLGEHVTKSFGR